LFGGGSFCWSLRRRWRQGYSWLLWLRRRSHSRSWRFDLSNLLLRLLLRMLALVEAKLLAGPI
jgi:hypothetical protein